MHHFMLYRKPQPDLHLNLSVTFVEKLNLTSILNLTLTSDSVTIVYLNKSCRTSMQYFNTIHLKNKKHQLHITDVLSCPDLLFFSTWKTLYFLNEFDRH